MKILKPCPFCKGKPEIIECGISGSIKSYYIKCKKCGCEIKLYSTKQNAIKRWNRRAEPNA